LRSTLRSITSTNPALLARVSILALAFVRHAWVAHGCGERQPVRHCLPTATSFGRQRVRPPKPQKVHFAATPNIKRATGGPKRRTGITRKSLDLNPPWRVLMVRRITQLMIQAADTRSQRRSRPRRQLIGALFCGLNERRGTPYAGISSLPIAAFTANAAPMPRCPTSTPRTRASAAR
jgi:hypothetical protein